MGRVGAIALFVSSFLLYAAPASAIVIGGGVTNDVGTFEKLSTSTPFSVGDDNFNTLNLYAFDEDQNISITSEIQVNVGTNPTAGQVVASHYVFFDPVNLIRQQGYVDFDANIFGIATSTVNLGASDFLINNAVTYLDPGLRGLESGDAVAIDLLLPYRLLVDWRASSPGDYVRVFTMESPGAVVPIPAALPLLLTGIFGLAFAARRRTGVGQVQGA